MKFISLPVLYSPDGYSEEMANDLDLSEEGILKVNPEAIDAYNIDSKGMITLRLRDGGAWSVQLTEKEFLKVLKDA